MKYKLYQLQFETKDTIHNFEIGTNNYNVVDLAVLYLANEKDILINKKLVIPTGYCEIGTTNKPGVNTHWTTP